jgi:Na+-driven multidrug efflux pump
MYIGFGVNVINACLNFLLIFGKLGLPAMGIAGAAIATVIANSCGAVAHVVYAHFSKQAFLGSLKEMTDWDLTFLAPVIRRIVPLIANEALFGFGNTLYVKAYGIISATALDIYKIGSTVGDFFYVVVTGLNSAIGLIVGEQLGRKDLDGARLSVRRLFPVSAITAVAVIIAVSVVAPPIVSLFSTTEPAVTAAAVTMVRLVSVRIAFRLFNIIFMGTLRAGGDTLFLAFLDCGIVWLVGVPLAFAGVCLFGITSLPALYALIQTEQVVRLVIGFLRYRQGKWCRNLTDETMKEA